MGQRKGKEFQAAKRLANLAASIIKKDEVMVNILFKFLTHLGKKTIRTGKEKKGK